MLSFDILSVPVDICIGMSVAAVAAVFTRDNAACPADHAGQEQRVAELEKLTVRTLEQTDELSTLYLDLAQCLVENDNGTEAVELYNKAEKVIEEALAQGSDEALQRKLGNVYLNLAVVYNDADELEEAEKYYLQAAKTFAPLDESGDGESTYDLAGVKLNLGAVYRENGELEKARTFLDEAFLLYRKVEKIGVFDTRYYLAKVSIQQGGVLFDLHQPLDKITDAYNRAMRLLVEVIEDGQQFELERELAAVLLDRCTAVYHDIDSREFDSEQERLNKIGDVLIDIGRAIDLLEKQVQSGNAEARVDLFNTLAAQAHILADIDKNSEAVKIFDRIIAEYADYGQTADGEDVPYNPMLMNEFADVCENRAACLSQLGDKEAAVTGFDKAIRIWEYLVKEEDADPEYCALFVPQLASAYMERAMLRVDSGQDKETAKSEIQHAFELLNNPVLGNNELIGSIKEQLTNILAAL